VIGHAKENPYTEIETGSSRHAEIKRGKKAVVEKAAAIIQTDRRQ
jgi:hypothetical protein